MSRFGWAYVSDIITGSGGTPGGSDKAIQFASGSTFSGSTNFTFDYDTNTVRLTGTLYADNLIVSSSTIFKSGSTKFGDDAADTHQFTGSVFTNNNVTVIGQVSASVALNTAGTIQAGSNITSFGIISGSSFLSNGNITSNGIISSSNGLNTGGPVTAGSIISSSAEIKSNSSITASSNIISTTGFVSASNGLYSGNGLTVNGSSVLASGLTVTGSSFVQALSSSAQIQATSFRGDGLNITGVLASNTIAAGNDWNVQYFDANTGYITGSSNLLFSGSTLTLTGSFLMTGSSTFVNIGPTILSGNLNVTGAITGNNAFLSGGLSVGNYVQMLPVGNVVIPTNQTASYIYTSGSTNDIYFTQYQPGTNFTNTTRLRWLEGSLSTGLLHGGILSTVTGTTSFNLSSGSGIIVTYNASTGSDPYPTINQVTWNNFVSQSLIYSSSATITYIAIDEFGAISQTNTAFTSQQFKDRIVIGRVLHQSGAVTNGVITTPTTAYGISSNTQDFFRAFGPLKVSGQVLASSGSATLAITRTAGDSYVEGRNYSSNPNSPNYVLAAEDPALTTTKIFYEWVSGSTINIDNNGETGYTALIPNKYNLNGTITTITPTNNKFTIQRVYWFPKSATRALYVYYGSTIYSSLAEAVAAIADEPNFTEGDNTRASAVYLGAVVMEAGISNFTDTSKSQVVNGGLFRATSNGGGGGGGVTSPGGSNHQIQFNDSGVFNGSANLTFDTTTLRLTGSFAMVGTGSLDIDGGYITGSGMASFGTVSGSVVTGSTALFTTITGSSLLSTNITVISGTLNTGATVVSHTIPSSGENFAVSNEYNDKLLSIESNATKDIIKIGPASSTAGLTTEIYVQGNPGDAFLEVSPVTTFLSNLSGTTAQFTEITSSIVTGSTGLFTTISASVVSASSYVGPIPKNAVFAANGITTTGTNYEVITVNGNKYLELQKRRTFPIARSIGAADSENGWIWLNRSSISGSSTENTTVVSGANFVHAQVANTTWTGTTHTAPVRYKTYTLLAGQNMQIVTKITATGSINFDQVQLLVWASGSNSNYVRVGVGYDTGAKIITQYTSNQNLNTTISASQLSDGVWFAVNITEDNFSSYYNFSTSSTPPTSGWLYNTGGVFILTTNYGRPLNVGQMIMNSHTNPQTVTGSFNYFDVNITRNELAGFVNTSPYVQWPATQFDTSGTEQLIGEYDLGSSATVNQTVLRQLLADLENNQYLENATITWSAVQSNSTGASSGTFYSSSALIVSGSGRYFRLWVKITSNGNQAGSIGPFPIVIPIS